MTTKKRKWNEWAVDLIKSTGRCPGEVPATGLPTEMMTEEEFELTLGGGTHPHEHCTHFRSEVMGMPVPEHLKELTGFTAAPVTTEDVERGKAQLKEEGGSLTAVEQFKRELHTYVDMVELKEGGKLYIPNQLLKLDVFLKKFFEVKAH